MLWGDRIATGLALGRWRGRQPAAKASMISMRAPQHGQESAKEVAAPSPKSLCGNHQHMERATRSKDLSDEFKLGATLLVDIGQRGAWRQVPCNPDLSCRGSRSG